MAHYLHTSSLAKDYLKNSSALIAQTKQINDNEWLTFRNCFFFVRQKNCKLLRKNYYNVIRVVMMYNMIISLVYELIFIRYYPNLSKKKIVIWIRYLARYTKSNIIRRLSYIVIVLHYKPPPGLTSRRC